MEKMTLIELFELGGWAMWPLLIFSIATISLIVERCIYIFSHNLKVKSLQDEVLGDVAENNIEHAKEYLSGQKKNVISKSVLLAGLDTIELGEHAMEKAMETEAAEQINNLERGFSFLTALGSLAPITGFLGTVSGMIRAFDDIVKATDVDAKTVAKGIKEALITTAFGLAIAILAIAAYNIFAYFIDKYTADIEQAGSKLTTATLFGSKKERSVRGFNENKK